MCQWDKDSCADAGFLKIDLLGLGMLSAVEECVDLIARHRGEQIDLSRVPLDDPDVFAEIQRADTVGCFQIESRAQMQTILRTRPENLDDITIQVALVRPGPIQGKAVHPYIERRQKLREDPDYEPPADHPLLRGAAARDARRRRLPGPGARRRDPSRRLQRRRGGGTAAGDEPQALARGARGVPRALRRGRAREGRRRGARAHGLRQARRLLGLRLPEVALGRVRAARVPVGVAAAPLRAGVPRGAPQRAADGLLSAGDARPRRAAARRGDAPARREPQRGRLHDRGRRRSCRPEVRDRAWGRTTRRPSPRSGRTPPIRELAQRTGLSEDELRALVESGACDSLRPAAPRAPVAARARAAPRKRARHGRGGEAARAAARARRSRRRSCPSRRCGSGCSPTTGRRACPSASTRSSCSARTCRAERSRARSFAVCRHGANVQLAGLVVARQRPATANGVVFMLLEDELAQVNLIVPPQVYERFRAVVRSEPLLLVRGRYEHSDRNRNVLVRRARLARAARAVADRRRRRPRRPAACPPLRPPLGGLGETGAVPQGRAGRRDSSLRSSAGFAGCCVLGRADRNRYRRSLRPCLATPIAPLRRAPFHQALLAA